MYTQLLRFNIASASTPQDTHPSHAPTARQIPVGQLQSTRPIGLLYSTVYFDTFNMAAFVLFVYGRRNILPVCKVNVAP